MGDREEGSKWEGSRFYPNLKIFVPLLFSFQLLSKFLWLELFLKNAKSHEAESPDSTSEDEEFSWLFLELLTSFTTF